jgi:hypothetical protein
MSMRTEVNLTERVGASTSLLWTFEDDQKVGTSRLSSLGPGRVEHDRIESGCLNR